MTTTTIGSTVRRPEPTVGGAAEAAPPRPLPSVARAATAAGVVAVLATAAGWAVLLLP